MNDTRQTSMNSNNNSEKFEKFDTCLTESMYQSLIKNSPHRHHPTKRMKMQHLVPIVFANFRTNLGAPKISQLKCLVNTGSSGTILFKDHGRKLRAKRKKSTSWNTSAGTFQTAPEQIGTCPNIREISPRTRNA